MATIDRTIPKYQDGYEVKYRSGDDLYHCLHNETEMSRKSGKPAAFKSLKQAKDFMIEQGALVATSKPKSALWTPPALVALPSIEAQLAALPASETRRFVVCEAPYATYSQRGYITVDRETGKQHRYHASQHTAWNDVYEQRQFAEDDANALNAAPPPSEKPRNVEETAAWRWLGEADEAWRKRFQQPLPEPTPAPVAEETTFVTASERYQEGDEFGDGRGNIYVATKASYYVSEQEAADLEDGWDATIDVGWHTEAKLVRRA